MSDTEPYQNMRRTIGTLVFLLAGPICWALHLTFTYGPQSALCASADNAGAAGFIQGPMLIVAFVTLAAALVCVLVLLYPKPGYLMLTGVKAPGDQWPFFRSVARLLAGLSLLAVIYAGTAALFLPTCAQLR